MNIPDQFEKLIEEGKITWREATLDDLSDWGKKLVSSYFEKYRIKWWLGGTNIEGSVVLKIDDPYIQYFDVLEETQQFLFCIDNHHNSIPPIEASIYLINKYHDVPEDIAREMANQVDSMFESVVDKLKSRNN